MPASKKIKMPQGRKNNKKIMAEELNKNNSIISELFQTFFAKHWPVWIGGIILGLLNVFLFMIKSPWGGSGGYNNWGENVYQAIGFLGLENVAPTNTSLYGMLNIIIILGAFAGALLSKEFALRIPPVGELIKGFIGGGLMAIGCTMGIGCTIGGTERGNGGIFQIIAVCPLACHISGIPGYGLSV